VLVIWIVYTSYSASVSPAIVVSPLLPTAPSHKRAATLEAALAGRWAAEDEAAEEAALEANAQEIARWAAEDKAAEEAALEALS
jgi:hypothetical protein